MVDIADLKSADHYGRVGSNPAGGIASIKARWSLNDQGCMITRHATGPGSWSTIMNVLALIQARLNKAARIAAAQKASLVYRGVPYAKA